MTAVYGDVFAQWRAGCREVWSAYTTHEFVAGLGDGTPPRDAFLRYLRQDYVFLSHFSRARALAVVSAGNLEEMKMAASLVSVLINEEMKLHIGVVPPLALTRMSLSRRWNCRRTPPIHAMSSRPAFLVTFST